MTVRPQIFCGFDALDLTLDLDCSQSSALDSLFRGDTLDVNGIAYAVSKHRPRTWNGSPMQRYLRRRHFHAGISRSMDQQTAWLRVQLRGAGLQSRSLPKWYGRILKIVKCLGLSIVGETVHGVDIRADLPGVSVHRFVERVESDCLNSQTPFTSQGITKTRKGQPKVHIGKPQSGVHATIYDEAYACKPQERERFIQACWGGSDPSYAARVEFQIGGECLRRRSIRTVHDLVEKLEKLVRHLTEEYLRFTETPSRNRQRAPTWKRWRQIRYALIKWARVPQDIPKLKLPPRDRSREVECLKASAVGSLIRVAALSRAPCETEEDLLLPMRMYLRQHNWRGRLAQKRAEIGIPVAGTPSESTGSPAKTSTRKRSKRPSYTGNGFN